MAVELQRFGRAGYDEPLDAQTFAAWLNKRIETYELEAEREAKLAGAGEAQSGAAERLADELGTTSRTLYRYRRCLNGDSEPTDVFPRTLIERMLEHAEVPLWEVYADINDDGTTSDRWCRSCKDLVTVGADGVCPWCETPSEPAAGREKRWCKRCDRLLFPADDDSCWRCGEPTKRRAPDIPCECGCGTMRPRFDGHGRRADYVRGHGRKPSDESEIDAAPFRAWLIAELRGLDPIEALAQRTGLSREDVQLVLNGRVDGIDRGRVRKALLIASRAGTVGKGAPSRPGALKLRDLYPTEVRSRTCTGCGEAKAPHAELCKRCRVVRNRATGGAPRGPRSTIGEHVLEEAKRMYDAGASFRTMAESLFEQVSHGNVESVSQAFSREFSKRGWKTRDRTREAA